MTYKTGAWGNQAKERSRQRRKYFREYRRINSSNNPKYDSDYIKKIYKEARLEALLVLGGKCTKCGFNDWRALQIDHINGGGCKHSERVSGPYLLKEVVRSYKAGENKYQLLCANCNFIKRYENNELVGIRRKGVKTY